MKNSRVLINVLSLALMILILGFKQPSYGFLSPHEEQQALLAIDNICGDSWCEGEYEYKFPSLVCSENSAACILNVEAYEWINADQQQLVEAKSCVIERVASVNDLVKNDMINIKVYEQISDCLFPR